MTALIALAAALAPALPVPMVSVRYLAAARDIWLRAVLALSALALAFHGELWLALMALWFTLRWRSPALHASLLTWVAIGATWFGLRALPAWAWDWISWGWVLIACAHVGLLVWREYSLPRDHPFFDRRTLLHVKRLPATHGSPAITAIALALMAPFCPWFLWPVLATGLFITWSWLAFIGTAVGLAWTYPTYAPHAFVAVSALLSAWVLTWWVRKFTFRGERWFEFVPRGDSFDSVINRLILWYLLVRAWWSGPRWLGRGPYSLHVQLNQWASRCWIETPNGEAHVEWAQTLYEYGLMGIVAMGAFAGSVLWSSRPGDPFSSAFMAGLAMTFAHWAPARHPAVALVWLACAAGALR